MLHPFIGYKLKGFIWYQGESNVDRANEYKKLFPAMIRLWRRKLVADRLAYWAFAKTYNIDGIAYSGPVYKLINKTSGDQINPAFDYVPNGLSSFGKELSGFQIAGEDKVFFPANARIEPDKNSDCLGR